MTRCASVNVTVRGTTLYRHPCTLDAGHHGECVDATGLRWTRVGELLRQLGLELAGHYVKERHDPHDTVDNPDAG